jgi:hypothetical protein
MRSTPVSASESEKKKKKKKSLDVLTRSDNVGIEVKGHEAVNNWTRRNSSQYFIASRMTVRTIEQV